MTNDGMSPVATAYTWNANGNALTIASSSASVSVTYDALGRAIETLSGSAYTQTLYGPNGDKLALMNSMSLVKAFVALPGGAQAVYTSGGLAYYRHSDWLGSSRLASTPGRTVYFDGAYAPYGEDYAKTGSTDLSFTGQTQDAIGGVYDFMFRRYNPVHGRWMSPDPAGLAAVDPMNPQTWNRYAYVANRPMSYVDPLGLMMKCFANFGDDDQINFIYCIYSPSGESGGEPKQGGSAGTPKSPAKPLEQKQQEQEPNPFDACPGTSLAVGVGASATASVGLNGGITVGVGKKGITVASGVDASFGTPQVSAGGSISIQNLQDTKATLEVALFPPPAEKLSLLVPTNGKTALEGIGVGFGFGQSFPPGRGVMYHNGQNGSANCVSWRMLWDIATGLW